MQTNPTAPSSGAIKPRLILHGGAGNILRENLPPAAYKAYRRSMLAYLSSTSELLSGGASALDAATHAVARLEEDPLFNCGRGAVFTRAGTIELEASVMVSRGLRKRGAGVTLVKGVRNPIRLAREILVRGEEDGSQAVRGVAEDPAGGRGGAQGHVFLSGDTCSRLAQDWGLDIVPESYHWTRRRWEEHRRGLERERIADSIANNNNGHKDEEEDGQGGESSVELSPDEFPDLPEWADIADEYWASTVANAHWDGKEYLPQGTVGAVCLDRYGTIAVATSTGGLTNKLPGRIGDTPTFGAGFWAEEWTETKKNKKKNALAPSDPLSSLPLQLPYRYYNYNNVPRVVQPPLASLIPTSIKPTVAACLPPSWAVGLGLMASDGTVTPPSPPPGSASPSLPEEKSKEKQQQQQQQKQLLGTSASEAEPTTTSITHAVGMSGTGNGDSFLRLAATRTMGAAVRFSSVGGGDNGCSLQSAVTQIIGPGGDMQRSAGDRWGRTGEGEGGTIGVELVDGVGSVAADLNCGGMFRAWVDDDGEHRMMVFRDEY